MRDFPWTFRAARNGPAGLQHGGRRLDGAVFASAYQGFLTGTLAWLILLFASVCEAAYVRDLFRFDGSVNRVEVQLWAGVWRWPPVSGYLFPATDTDFSRRLTNEILVGVFRARSVNGEENFSGEFTGYFAVQISSARFSFESLPGSRSPMKTAATYSLAGVGVYDPFQIVTDSISLVTFTDPHPNFPPLGGDFGHFVSAATDGELFARFGFGWAVDRELGGAADPGVLSASWNYQQPKLLHFAGGLNLLEIAPEFQELVFPGVANPLTGGVNSLALHFLLEPANPGPWPWKGTGIIEFRVIPEPHTVAVLVSLVLAGAGGRILRRKGRCSADCQTCIWLPPLFRCFPMLSDRLFLPH